MSRLTNSSEHSVSSIDTRNLREETNLNFDARMDTESLEYAESLLINDNDYFYSNDCNDLEDAPFDKVRAYQNVLLHDASRTTSSHFSNEQSF